MMAAQKLVLLHSVRLSEVVEHADRDQRLAAGSRDHTIDLRRRSVVHRQIGNRPPRLSKSDDVFPRVVESDDSERITGSDDVEQRAGIGWRVEFEATVTIGHLLEPREN